MFRRIFSFFMPLLLVLGLLPVSAFASEFEPIATVDVVKEWSGFPTFTIALSPSAVDNTNIVLAENVSGEFFVITYTNQSTTSYQKAVLTAEGSFQVQSYNKDTNEKDTGIFYVNYYELITNSMGNEVWNRTYQSPQSSGYYSVQNVKSLLSSDENIYNEAGDVVFPPVPGPLQAILEQVAGLVIPPIVTTLKILIPFGVGLMASLIVCHLLRKLLFRFLG